MNVEANFVAQVNQDLKKKETRIKEKMEQVKKEKNQQKFMWIWKESKTKFCGSSELGRKRGGKGQKEKIEKTWGKERKR